jgi:hypothetical protein
MVAVKIVTSAAMSAAARGRAARYGKLEFAALSYLS